MPVFAGGRIGSAGIVHARGGLRVDVSGAAVDLLCVVAPQELIRHLVGRIQIDRHRRGMRLVGVYERGAVRIGGDQRCEV